MPRIVISYRRADSAAIAGRIFDRLTQRYGGGAIFMDIDEIPFGIDFRDHIAEVLATCDAIVAVMGPRWLTGSGETSRILDETDPVRIEVQAALERGIPVIPVLVEGAGMPQPTDLPEPLVPLAYRNACEVASGRDFHVHVDRLIRAIDRLFPQAEEAKSPEAAISPAALDGVVDVPAAASSAALAPPEPLGPLRTAILVAALALPQAVQFTARTELFVVALVVSTIGVVAVIDREGPPLLRRFGTGALVALGNLVVQGALGVARAALVTW